MANPNERLFAEVAAKLAQRQLAVVRQWIEIRKEATLKSGGTSPLSAGKRRGRRRWSASASG